MRQPLVAANWKMHKTLAETRAFFPALAAQLGGGPPDCELVVCPPFTAIAAAVAARDAAFGAAGAARPPRIGAQNAHGERQGAYTGEVAAEQLREAGAEYAILGHSERRQLFGETDAGVAARLRGVLLAGLRPILCVGETAAERRAGQTNAVIARQVQAACAGLQASDLPRLAIAYEPVWAIGTGTPATPADAQEAAAYIRGLLAGTHGAAAASAVRVLYGGSVTATNADGFFAQPDIDGALVGGASLDPAGLAAIARAAGGCGGAR